MKKKKILLTVLAITVMLMVFAVPCFAYDTTSGQEFVFNEVLTFDSVPESETTFNVSFVSNDVEFDRITITYRGFYAVSYHNDNLNLEVYNDNAGWVAGVEFRYLTFTSDTSISSYGIFFTDNEYGSSSGNFYSLIYDIIVSSIYGDLPLTSDMKLTVSLISTILSILCVLAPILVCGAVFVWVLKRV